MSCDHDGCTCTPASAPTSGELPRVPHGGHAGAGGCCGGHGHQNGEPTHRSLTPPVVAGTIPRAAGHRHVDARSS
jgi:hypothetical protein